jgi:hypothetical protein
MAEIKIERRKQIWPWMLVGLVIAASLVYFIAIRDNSKIAKTDTQDDYNTDTEKQNLIGVNENNSTVAAYVNFVENSNQQMSLDHAYTNEALLKLTDATNAMADEVGYEVRADLEKVKEYATMITKDPFDTTHADNIRKANDIITTVLHNIQKAHYPSLVNDIEELKIASALIKPDVLTLDQKDAVKNFFAKASDLLKKMN